MGQKTKIEWTDASWSPLRVRVRPDAGAIAEAKGYASLIQIAGKMAGHVGPHCEHVSDGCTNCYSGRDNHRCLPKNGTGLPFDRRSRDLVEPFVDEKILDQPLHWKTPRRIFVENQSDLFGEWLPIEHIARAFAVMAEAEWHTFQVLTKRADRLLDVMEALKILVAEAWEKFDGGHFTWPLPNVHLGVSIEDQPTADARVMRLSRTPAARRFLSYEPALGPVDFRAVPQSPLERMKIDWIIAGGESGPGARPPHPDWFRAVRDQCQAAQIPFFFKQWGEFYPLTRTDGIHESPFGGQAMIRSGKSANGALLDGREWKEFPRVAV